MDTPNKPSKSDQTLGRLNAAIVIAWALCLGSALAVLIKIAQFETLSQLVLAGMTVSLICLVLLLAEVRKGLVG
jgi:hypothetical protein